VIVDLPWPPRALSPNAREHRMRVADVKAKYRRACWALTREAMGRWTAPASGKLSLAIVFCPPDNRRRDLDNMLAGIKAGLDGVADAVGCDDSLWTLTITRGAVVPGGNVFLTIA
jgi:crossover junction endodeoxyribonuclease RusA